MASGQDERPGELEALRARVRELEEMRGLDPAALSIASAVADNILLLDPEGRIEYANWTVPDLSPESVRGKPVVQFVPPSFREHILDCLARVRASHAPDRYETAYVAENDEVSTWESRVSPILRDGGLAGFAVVSSNVTERRQAAIERERFFNLSLDILASAGFDGRFKRVNPAFERTLGFEAAELLATPFLKFVHPDDRTATVGAMARLEQGETVTDFGNRYRRRDGSYRWISWRAVADPVRRLIYAVGRDDTDRRAIEAHLRQAQKMDAVGQLAAGIAHDFNNLLLVMRLHLEAVARAGDEGTTGASLQPALQAVERATSLSRQLLVFSRQQPVPRQVVAVAPLVRELSTILRRLLPEDIEIRVSVGGEALPVDADPGQLEQVLVNLAINARDAMPAGGTLSVDVEHVEIGDGGAVASGVRPGRYVRLRVSDTGSGMTAEVKERAFEPFFTTKPSGKGTGLGLAIVYGTVVQHGGSIRLLSEVGQGTTFIIDLPAVDGVPVAAAGAELLRGGRGETILLAEDDDMVRALVKEVVEEAGYRAIAVRDGVEAVAAFREHREHIGAVLLDVVMPKMGGVGAATQIRAVDATVPLLFTSGYADVAQFDRSAFAGVRPLEKPYRPAQLLQRLRELLDDRLRAAPPTS